MDSINTIKQYLPEILGVIAVLLGASYVVTERATKKDLPSELGHYANYKLMTYLMFFLFLFVTYFSYNQKIISSGITDAVIFVLIFVVVIGFYTTF